MRYLFCICTVALALFLVTAPTLIAQDGDPTDSTAPVPSDPTALPAAESASPRPVVDTVTAVQEAGRESAGALSGGAHGLADQGSQIWQAVLVPMGQRIAVAIPELVKAVLLFLAFWVAAILLAALTRKLLTMTEVDNRAVEDWGLAGLLRQEDGSSRSLEDLAGRIVKWTVLLFGFVAFFQALDLDMVAGPLQNVAESILGVIPSLLQAAVILIAYWILATMVRAGLTKVLALAKFDDRAGKYFSPREEDGKAIGPSSTLGRLAFYLILLFGLPPFLEALGQTAMVLPLTNMLEKSLTFLPNIVAAVILFFIGKLVATIVREIVGNFLAASGVDGSIEKMGLGRALGSRRLSEIVASIVYFFILISISVAAIDALKITAISEPVTTTLGSLLAALPLLFVAVVVLSIGYVIARAVGRFVEAFLVNIDFDHYPERFGLTFMSPGEGRKPLSAICGIVVMSIIMVLTIEQALASLQLERLSTMIGSLVAYLPSLLAGVAIVLVTLSLASYVKRLILDALGDGTQAKISALVAWSGILFLGISMGLAQLGLGEDIVRIVVAATLFGAALAIGLAFGLGGQEKARKLLEQVDGSSS